MGHVFISYSRQDRAYVERLAAHLQAQGIDAWYDHEIRPGERWSTTIRRMIETCDAMVVVMSRAAEASEMVENEIDLARSLRKPLLPLLLDGEPFFGLRHVQYTDVRDQTMPGTSFTSLVVQAGATPAAAVPTRTEADEPPQAVGQGFLMPVEDVFTIRGRGTVVTGVVVRSGLRTGEAVEIVGLQPNPIAAVCQSIETFRKVVKEAPPPGQSAGLLFREFAAAQVQRGMVVAAPGSIRAYRRFAATVAAQGFDAPLVDHGPVQVRLWGAEVPGVVTLPDGERVAGPGQLTSVVITLGAPVAIEVGLTFELREAERTVATGQITRALG